MPDETIDRELAAVAAPLSADLDREARRLATAIKPEPSRAERIWRPRWVLPLVVGGALALTAGAGAATVALSHWAGVGMPLDNVRSQQPIRLSWTTEEGHEEQCRAWIELRNPESGDQRELDAAISARDWSGLGQELYDRGPVPDEDGGGESRVSERLAPELMHLVDDVFPGTGWLDAEGDPAARAVDAWGMACVPETW